MKRDDTGLFARDAANLAIAICDISMRCAVKSVASHFVATIKLIRERVEISALRKRLMKRSIEDGDLRKTCAEKLAGRLYATNVRRVVKRGKLYAIFYPFDYRVIDED